MMSIQNRIILSEGPPEIHGGAHICVYHRDFPENWAPGETPGEAARSLMNSFEKNLDSAADPLHRESIQRAMADLRDFLSECDPNRSCSVD